MDMDQHTRYGYSVYPGVHPVPLSLFLRASKNLMRPNAFFESLQPQNVLMMFLFSMKHLQKLIFTLCERATIADSLHVWRNFWCLLRLELNWCSMYMSRHSFGGKFLQEISVIVILIFCLNFPSLKVFLICSYLFSIFNLVPLRNSY